MMYGENKPTRLTLEHYDKMVWEGSWDSGLEEIMNGFLGCLIGVGFTNQDIVLEHIRDWAEDRLGTEGKDDIEQLETGEEDA